MKTAFKLLGLCLLGLVLVITGAALRSMLAELFGHQSAH